jgi:hypothetical protein
MIPKGPRKVTWNNFHYAYVFMGSVFCATDGYARDLVKYYFWQPRFVYIRVF